MRRAGRFGAGLLGVALVAWGTFTWHKAAGVARELLDPPFYKPQPLERVEATYAALARGGQGDPGGVWRVDTYDGLQVWTLKRPFRARGRVLLLHGFGDDRWGTAPALRQFPDLDASIFTYLRRDDVLRRGGQVPVTFGAKEHEDVVKVVKAWEAEGLPRHRMLLSGRSLGASVGLLALARLECEGGPLGGILWEGAPASSRDFGARLVRGPQDRWWHPFVAPLAGRLGSWWAAHRGGYRVQDTDLGKVLEGRRLRTPSLTFIATQDRLAPLDLQRKVADSFVHSEKVEVSTWHIHCAEALGSVYGERVRKAVERWIPPEERFEIVAR